MTREEAIIYLKQADVTVGRDIKTKTAEALDMAIKALEQETVSKESYDHEYFLRKELEIKIAKLQRQLEEQEPKTGHWTYICNSSVNGLKIVECSECGTRTYGSGSFCPYCGAKMVEPQESEET